MDSGFGGNELDVCCHGLRLLPCRLRPRLRHGPKCLRRRGLPPLRAGGPQRRSREGLGARDQQDGEFALGHSMIVWRNAGPVGRMWSGPLTAATVRLTAAAATQATQPPRGSALTTSVSFFGPRAGVAVGPIREDRVFDRLPGGLVRDDVFGRFGVGEQVRVVHVCPYERGGRPVRVGVRTTVESHADLFS